MPDQGPPINVRGDFPDKQSGKEKWVRPKTAGIRELSLHVSDRLR